MFIHLLSKHWAGIGYMQTTRDTKKSSRSLRGTASQEQSEGRTGWAMGDKDENVEL